MIRQLKSLPVLLSMLCLLAGLLLITTSQSRAQDPAEAEFIGSRECMACHRDTGRQFSESPHALALQEPSRSEDAIVADFTTGEDVRAVQFPGEATARPFTAEDVAFVMGYGHYVQRYVYEDQDGGYRLFPAEWNVIEQTWQPFELASSWEDPAYDWTTNCAGCHTTGYNLSDVDWVDIGVQCEACHGAGSTHADLVDDAGRNPSDEEMAAIRDAIVADPDAQACGQCHVRGTNPLADAAFPTDFNIHSMKLTDESVFILPPQNDEVHWWQSGQARLSNMQFNEWLTSGHAEHDVACSTCHTLHSETDQPALLVKDSYSLCVDCHQQSAEAEVSSPVREMVEGLAVIDGIDPQQSAHFTDENGPECVTCHMTEMPVQDGERPTHTFAVVLPDEGAPVDSCTSCHTNLSPDYMASFVTDTQSGVAERLDAINNMLVAHDEAAQWILDAVDFVVQDGSYGVHNYAYTNQILDAVEVELGLVQTGFTEGVYLPPATDPSECLECHTDEHRLWQASPHANASLQDNFLTTFAEQGQPAYCMTCHASGYNPDTSTYAFEGVVCSSCHVQTTEGEHPPAPIEAGDESQVCGACHSGAHAPTYNEWLASDHRLAGVDCVDCHTPHNNGLILGDVNTTCGDCHADAMNDDVHMGAEMTCVDCHMAPHDADGDVMVTDTGHTMAVEAHVCADCHGDLHNIEASSSTSLNTDETQIHRLEKEIDELEEESDNRLNTGVVGGALGMVVVMSILFIVFRLRGLL